MPDFLGTLTALTPLSPANLDRIAGIAPAGAPANKPN